MHAASVALTDTTLINGSTTMATAEKWLTGLCLHPTSLSMIYATCAHQLLKFDWTGHPDIAVMEEAAGEYQGGRCMYLLSQFNLKTEICFLLHPDSKIKSI